jgi:hypothetical protein
MLLIDECSGRRTVFGAANYQSPFMGALCVCASGKKAKKSIRRRE